MTRHIKAFSLLAALGVGIASPVSVRFHGSDKGSVCGASVVMNDAKAQAGACWCEAYLGGGGCSNPNFGITCIVANLKSVASESSFRVEDAAWLVTHSSE
jgi:hypothetical protein